MKLRTGACVLGLAGCLAAKDYVFADPGRGAALIGDLSVHQVLAFKRGHLFESVGWNFGSENCQVGSKPGVGHMICGSRDGGQRCALRVQSGAHPNAVDAYVALHVHAVRAVVWAGDVAQFRLIEVGDIAPEAGLHLAANVADARGPALNTPESQAGTARAPSSSANRTGSTAARDRPRSRSVRNSRRACPAGSGGSGP